MLELMSDDIAEGKPMYKVLGRSEPIYSAINWISLQLGWGIYGVNSACALIFLSCIAKLAAREPLPFLLVSLAIPYFFIVVGMGYTRQGVASSLIMASIIALRDGRSFRFFIFIVCAAGFHSSSCAFFPAVLFSNSIKGKPFTANLFKLAILGVGVYGAFNMFQDQYSAYVDHYVESDRYSSGGAVLRSSVTAIGAVLFLLNFKSWNLRFGDQNSLMYFAIASLAVVPLSFVASTPADRMGLYLIPFQLIVFARLPLLTNNQSDFDQTRLLVVSGYIAYFFVWLHLGTYSQRLWVPYSSALW